jgi:acyl-CoA thioesterase
MEPLSALLDVLTFEDLGGGKFRARNAPGGRGVVFGGQMLGQTIVAATNSQPGKEVKTVHTIFARGGRVDQDLDMTVDVMHNGRTFGSDTVTMAQGDRLCARSLVLLHEPESDMIRHADPMPDVPGPAELPSRDFEFEGYEMAVVGGVDISDPDDVGEAILEVWIRWRGAPDDLATSQALLAYATDGFLIGTAMRPHEGVSQANAHLGVSTGVVSHTLTFHEPFRASDWMLLDQYSSYAGRGRAYGRAHVFTEDGTLVASFVQDSMIRNMPEGVNPGNSTF